MIYLFCLNLPELSLNVKENNLKDFSQINEFQDSELNNRNGRFHKNKGVAYFIVNIYFFEDTQSKINFNFMMKPITFFNTDINFMNCTSRLNN